MNSTTARSTIYASQVNRLAALIEKAERYAARKNHPSRPTYSPFIQYMLNEDCRRQVVVVNNLRQARLNSVWN